jgi:ketosteroid isomerase-like protein
MTRRVGSLWSAVVALSFSGCAQTAPTFSEADRAAIRQLNDSAVAHVRARNSSAWAALHTEDAILMPPNHPAVRGRAALATWLDSFPPLTSLSSSEPVIDGSRDIAVLHSAVSMTLAPPGGQPVNDVAKQLVVLRRQPNGSWLATLVSFNSDLPVSR